MDKMNKESCLFYNEANEDARRYPKQISTICAVETGLKQRGYNVDKYAIKYHGEGTIEVLRNVIEQVRPHFEAILGKSIVSCHGDGGTSLLLNALCQLAMEKGGQDLKAPFVAPAGTYNLLSKELGTPTVQSLLRAINREAETHAQKVLMRDMSIKTYEDSRSGQDRSGDSECELRDEVTYPWTLFAGYGADGRIIAQSEFAPRSRPNIVNALIITSSMLKYITMPEEGRSQIDTYSAMAIPYYGPYRFDKSLSRLGERSFQTITYHADFGGEALEYFTVINSIGLSRKVNSALWEFLGKTKIGRYMQEHSKLMRIAMDVRLEEKEELEFIMKSGKHYLHLDGYPLIIDVDDGEFCTVSMQTGDKSIEVMKNVE